jgi:hypothetical protein
LSCTFTSNYILKPSQFQFLIKSSTATNVGTGPSDSATLNIVANIPSSQASSSITVNVTSDKAKSSKVATTSPQLNKAAMAKKPRPGGMMLLPSWDPAKL